MWCTGVRVSKTHAHKNEKTKSEFAEPCVAVHTFNPGPQEAEADRAL